MRLILEWHLILLSGRVQDHLESRLILHSVADHLVSTKSIPERLNDGIPYLGSLLDLDGAIVTFEFAEGLHDAIVFRHFDLWACRWLDHRL